MNRNLERPVAELAQKSGSVENFIRESNLCHEIQSLIDADRSPRTDQNVSDIEFHWALIDPAVLQLEIDILSGNSHQRLFGCR